MGYMVEASCEDTWMQFVCREYADTVHLHCPAGYLTDFDNGITNGYLRTQSPEAAGVIQLIFITT